MLDVASGAEVEAAAEAHPANAMGGVLTLRLILFDKVLHGSHVHLLNTMMMQERFLMGATALLPST